MTSQVASDKEKVSSTNAYHSFAVDMEKCASDGTGCFERTLFSQFQCRRYDATLIKLQLWWFRAAAHYCSSEECAHLFPTYAQACFRTANLSQVLDC